MKDKTTAALFALFLGWFGVHRFYLRQPGLGVLYILLSFVGISLILGFIDFIVLLAMDPKEFDRRYNSREEGWEHDRYERRKERSDYRSARHRERHGTRRTERRPATGRSGRRPPTKRKSRDKTRKYEVPERRRVNPYKQSGIKKYKEFDIEGAIEDFNKGLEIDARDIALHFNLACAYSLSEQPDKAYYHIDKAVEYGFKDFERINTHDDLAFVRIQPRFEQFKKNGYRIETQKMLGEPQSDLLQDEASVLQLKRLTELRDKGLITEKEFLSEKQKLTRE